MLKMQLPLLTDSKPRRFPATDSSSRRAIECDDFPFEELSRIAQAESWRKEIYRPVYHIHKWWAKRLGSVFRGIVLGTLTPQGSDILDLFYSPVRFPNAVVFDPFMGSGTTLGETLKLGGRAIGRDINPVSYLQVRTALTLKEADCLKETYREVEKDVADRIAGYYTARLPDGALCPVLYYFWVMQAQCPDCAMLVDLFSTYIFSKHADARRDPSVRVVCPCCGNLSRQDHRVSVMVCGQCNNQFDPRNGVARGKMAACANCGSKFAIAPAIRKKGGPPSYRMYAKLVLTPDGKKEYLPINDWDESLYRKAESELEGCSFPLPTGTIQPGYNTDQVLNYGFTSWRQMFNSRQLLCASILANRIKAIEDEHIRNAFVCLFSGAMEFSNMFASYKGEGTGAVRHMFSHHILKPERTPVETNLWGTPKSSGAFSTLFQRRLLRAVQYAGKPFEVALSTKDSRNSSVKVESINESLLGMVNSESYEQFAQRSKLYVSCGDSSRTDLPTGSVDAVITDPPFFDNVHYSQLADFFYSWQKSMLGESRYFGGDSTRSDSEVQDSDSETFARKLMLVFAEAHRVLKDDGILAFTYHHSRPEGWRSVLQAVVGAGFHIQACHPIKAEMSVSKPIQQAKDPINLDTIMVCRKTCGISNDVNEPDGQLLESALERAEYQVFRLRKAGWKLGRTDVKVVVIGQVVAGISRRFPNHDADRLFSEINTSLEREVDRVCRGNAP